MRFGAHNSRNARKGVRGSLPTRADDGRQKRPASMHEANHGRNANEQAGRIPAKEVGAWQRELSTRRQHN